MAYDFLRSCHTGKDWSCGASDLPTAARGYTPERFWNPTQMEAKLAEIMNQKGFFGTKPSRKDSIAKLADYMKSNKIGPTDVSGGLSSEVGSLLLPAKQQKALFNKIDDVRYDIRGAKASIGVGMLAIAGGLAFLGIASIYRSSKGR